MRVALALILVAACAGEEEAGPPVSVTGTWRRLALDELDRQDIIEFRADGTMTSQLRGAGTYTLEGSSITTELGTEVRTQDYARDGAGALLFQALRPVGEVDGFRGTWRGSVLTGDVFEHWTLILTDNLATIEHRGDNPYVLEGGWSTDGNSIFFFPQGGSREMAFRGLPGRVIGLDPLVIF